MKAPALAAIVVLSAATGRAQEPVKVELRCPSACTFRQGESIWLNLSFTTSTPNEFKVLTNYTDREMAREEFSVSPDGWSDPIMPYLPAIKIQGGSFSFRYATLVTTPATVRLNLNQFVRFDQPGTYRVSVTSHRASHIGGAAVEAQSNQVTVGITPADPQWQKQQLTRILTVLDGLLSQSNQPPDEVRDLCNLGTRDAALEIARRMGDRSAFFHLYQWGLIRSPYRAEGIQEMERLLLDPDFAVNDYFLGGLDSATAVDPQTGELRPYNERRDEIRRKLTAAISNKRGGAKTASEAALGRFR